MDTTATPRKWTYLLVLFLVGLVGCGQGPTAQPTVASVSVDPSSIQLGVGATATLEATVHATGNVDRSVTWTSEDASIAEVDDDGAVTGVAAGTTHVTATSGQDPTKSASVEVVVSASSPAPLDWTVQFGTSELDLSAAVAVDSEGFVLVVGSTAGALAGPNAGGRDAFVRKYTPDGDEVWTRQFGTSAWDEALAVTTDADDNILVAGATWGDLSGPNQGNSDVFIRQYSPAGDEGWTVQFGTTQHDRAIAIAIDDSGDLIVAGQGVGVADGEDGFGYNGFVRKYRLLPGGGVAEEWTFVPQARPDGLAVDATGNVVAVGQLWVEGFGSEAYVVKLAPAGNVLWTGVYGTGAVPEVVGGERDEVPPTRWPTELWENLRGFEEAGRAVAVDATGNVFVTGYMGGFDTGTGHASQRAFVQKLTPAGAEEWAVLFGDAFATFGNAIAIGASGDVILAGNTASFYGERTPPGTETFTRRLAPDGTLLWDDTFGESGWDTSHGMAIDAQGNVYTVGHTLGDLGAPNLGASDAFLRKYGP